MSKKPENIRTNRRPTLLVCIALCVLTVAVYWQTANHDFLNYDDKPYVTENSHVRAGLTWKGIAWAFTSECSSNWHPLTWLSHMLDVEIYGVSPGGHHLTNLLFHIANTLLLFLVLARITGAFWRPAVVAALFALHPLHVESVAWIAERKDVLSALFWMLILWAYVRYVRAPAPGRYGVVVLLYFFGLMAKPMLVTLPFVLLLLDYWPLRRLEGKVSAKNKKSAGYDFTSLIREKLPLFLLSAGSSIVTFFVQRHGQAVQSLDIIPLPLRIENSFVAYASYILKSIWPHHLAVYYPHPMQYLPAWQIIGAIFLLVALTVVSYLTVRKHPYVLVGWLWFLGTLVPVIGIVQVGGQAMADRYTYVPLIGLFIAGVWGIESVVTKWIRKRTMMAMLAGIVITAFGIGAWVQAGYWENNITLFSHALEVTKKNQLAHNQLGLALMKAGKTKEAIGHFHQAIRITPQYADPYINLGNVFKDLGELDKAAEEYRLALQFDPNHETAKNNLAVILAMEGKMEEGLALLSQVLSLNPEDVRAHTNMGIILAKQGKVNEALNHFNEALRIDPQSESAKKNLQQLNDFLKRSRSDS